MDIHAEISFTTRLSHSSKVALKTGNFTTFADLLVTPIPEVARKCKISTQDAKAIYDTLLKDSKPLVIPTLDELNFPIDEVFSTANPFLDQALGGGIRTGMLWEIVGESAAGKSQLVMQLSLAVQNPPSLGGIMGAACYLTTSSQLPTTRLTQILQSHSNLSKETCSLDNIHTIRISTSAMLLGVLTNLLPNFIQKQSTSSHPVKLVIIDALTELFHSEKMTKTTLFERSKELNRLSAALHSLAATYNVAIIAVNEVIDRFERSSLTHSYTHGELIYSEQSRFFGTSNSVPGENAKEASLGLVWANAVNARIMMSRTRRRRYIGESELTSKRARTEPSTSNPSTSPVPTHSSDPASEDQSTLIRRLSIIFSSVSPSTSLDYIVTVKGITVLPDDSQLNDKPLFYQLAEEEEPQGVEPTTHPRTSIASPSTLPTPPPLPSQHNLETQLEDDEEDEYDRILNTEDTSFYDAYEQQLTQTT